jgi:hypothetical protein
MKTLASILCITAFLLFIIVALRLLNHIEAFGMSPGTLDQLQSTHVPTEEDVETQLARLKEMDQESVELTGLPFYNRKYRELLW